ncbi:uncharacterized protein BDR25DRAFT_356723 [Lindgomyces ingoldianus]|uniref:Uncharacterized protein n=1 Tax=Lindgomyces ingoldianus TaxID=673940 RepID=A0ACB6QR75_9PLEO|nr:uncharacterized protein BDR25DRAFT_356723 [Lindgomyces ingoldianus]KAF2469503.1 hypothetical protein BDR25DRAFT_356723 [Lindgomyces ingoldianus]
MYLLNRLFVVPNRCNSTSRTLLRKHSTAFRISTKTSRRATVGETVGNHLTEFIMNIETRQEYRLKVNNANELLIQRCIKNRVTLRGLTSTTSMDRCAGKVKLLPRQFQGIFDLLLDGQVKRYPRSRISKGGADAKPYGSFRQYMATMHQPCNYRVSGKGLLMSRRRRLSIESQFIGQLARETSTNPHFGTLD